MQATRLIWAGAGKPDPFDCEGKPIARAKEKLWSHCACCGEPEGRYTIKDVISTNFMPVRNESRLTPYGGNMFCAACVFCARTLRLRCSCWTATEAGITFWPTRPPEKGGTRPDALATVLNPPEPPFVIGLPLYGISHGGEAHWRRTPWPKESPEDVLIRLQSKHVAMYARAGMSRDRYPIQVDDDGDYVVDRELWLQLREAANEWMQVGVDAGVKPFICKKSLLDLSIPYGIGFAGVAKLMQLKPDLRRHSGSVWWPLFCELIPTLPESEDREIANGKKTAKRDHVTAEPARRHEGPAPSPSRPPEGDRKKNESRGDGKRQVQLALF